MLNKFESFKGIMDHLSDEESCEIFQARLEYLVYRNQERYMNTILSLDKEWRCSELDCLSQEAGGIIIFGAGVDGRFTRKVLIKCGYEKKLAGFCDSSPALIGKSIEGLPIWAPGELCKHSDCIVVISSRKYAAEIYDQLLCMRTIPRQNIYYPAGRRLRAVTGNQYFDIFLPKEKEIFIDGGAYNGDTLLQFMEWTQGEYEKVYAFEPGQNAGIMCKNTIAKYNIKNCEFVAKGTWSQEKLLSFYELTSQMPASYFEESNKPNTPATTIDNVVRQDKVTFIKLDVEGRELESLKGARRTILSNRPRLAISLYHKPEDIFQIPSYILSLIPDYKLKIRHYRLSMNETVLYAE